MEIRSVGKDWCQIFKIRPAHGHAGFVSVDSKYIEQSAEFFTVVWQTGNAFDLIACLQIEAADLGRRNIDILVAGQEIVETKEPEAAV